MGFKINMDNMDLIYFLNFYDKKNYKKLIIMGVILISIGFYCISRKSVGINIFSWGIALCFLYATWLAFKEVNELNKYAVKSQVNMMRLRCLGFLVMSILLFVFPRQVNMILSILLGIYLLYKEIRYFLKCRNYAGYSFGTWDIIKVILGLMLIISPLFFTRFLVSVLSFIAIVFGISFIAAGVRLVND